MTFAHGGKGRSPGGDEGPMFFIGCTRGDPALEGFLLRGRDRTVRLGWRHDFVLVLGEESLHELTAGGVSRDEGLLFHGFLADIQSQFSLALIGIGTVAIKAVLGQDRTNVAIVLKGCGLGGGHGNGR